MEKESTWKQNRVRDAVFKKNRRKEMIEGEWFMECIEHSLLLWNVEIRPCVFHNFILFLYLCKIIKNI